MAIHSTCSGFTAAGGMTHVLLKLVGAFVPQRVSRANTSSKASTFRSTARLCSKISI
jgi:hypothetical protein